MSWVGIGAAGGSLAAGLLGGGDSGGDSMQLSGFRALPKDVRGRLTGAAGSAQDLFNQGPQEFFPGQTFADLTPEQRSGLEAQLAFAQNQLPGQLGQVNQSFGNALNAGNIFGDPSVQAGLGTIENRANQNFSENILPQLRQQATGTGNQFSSKAEQSERLAGRDLQQLISDSQSSFLANQLGSARGLQGQTIGNAPNISQLGLLPGSTQFDVGSVLQGQNQLQTAEDVNRFNFGQQAPGQNINDLISRLTAIGGAGSGGISTTPGSPSGTNTLSSILGGGLLGGELFKSLAPSFSGGGNQNLSFSGANNQPAALGSGGFGSNFGNLFPVGTGGG